MAGHKYQIAVIGGGASGIVAAIRASQRGASVVLCERMPKPGKKILASGNGRCNLLNDCLDESYYNESSRKLVKAIFARFGKEQIKRFFADLGLEFYSESGRIFPVTNQSSSVLKVLEIALKRSHVNLVTNFDTISIRKDGRKFLIKSKSSDILEAGTVVICCGGKSYPALGSDGSGYKLAKDFGHKVVEPVTGGVPFLVKDSICHRLQGQKIAARLSAVVRGKVVNESSGDLLFTKYGLSGSAIIDISREISVAINRDKISDVSVRVDMVPFLDRDDLSEKLNRRIRDSYADEDILAGILPEKFGSCLKDILKTRDPSSIVGYVKNKSFTVSATRGWNEAYYTAGGVDVNQVNQNTLESNIVGRVYFAGEVLDVDGRRGGYNLAWAWASGYVSSEECVKCVR